MFFHCAAAALTLFFYKGIIKKDKSIQSGDIYVDGSRIGDVSNVVIKDRTLMSNNGILAIIINVDSINKKLLNTPLVTTRGYILVNESIELIKKIELESKKIINNYIENIREIEGALLSLKANANYMGRKISTSLAKDVLKVYVQMSHKEISIARITEIVCQYYNIDEQSFNSTKRTREVAQARQVAMYLAKQHTKAPLAAIGAAIGGRNHATVLHSCKTVSNMIETDKVFKNQIDELEKIIAAG